MIAKEERQSIINEILWILKTKGEEKIPFIRNTILKLDEVDGIAKEGKSKADRVDEKTDTLDGEITVLDSRVNVLQQEKDDEISALDARLKALEQPKGVGSG